MTTSYSRKAIRMREVLFTWSTVKPFITYACLRTLTWFNWAIKFFKLCGHMSGQHWVILVRALLLQWAWATLLYEHADYQTHRWNSCNHPSCYYRCTHWEQYSSHSLIRKMKVRFWGVVKRTTASSLCTDWTIIATPTSFATDKDESIIVL